MAEDNDNVVYLKFASPHTEEGYTSFMSCRLCHNKTFVFIHDRIDGFPLMKCAACDQHMGRMGWAHDDDPLIDPPKDSG